ncbi:MAG: MbnH family di-heme enzyme [Lautropia sp.]
MRAPAFVAALAATGLAIAGLAGGCGGGGTNVTEIAAASGDWVWRLPPGLPVPAVPDDNPMSVAKVELGRFLFYDRRLSANGTQSCGSCHRQALAFTDGRVTSIGSTGDAHPRNAQPLANVAYSPTLIWANPALDSLERQMTVPLFGDNPVEMGLNDGNKDAVLDRIGGAYGDRFRAAFPGDAQPVSWSAVIKAIAAFQRSIVAADSRFDRYQRGEGTLTASELRGLDLFNSEKAECFHCHTSFNLNDQVRHAASRLVETPFHNTGLYDIDGAGGFPFPNRGLLEITGVPTDMGRFRAASLRNVAVTAPYMHDGSIATLDGVLDFYAAGGRVIASGPLAGDGRRNPFRSVLVGRIELSAQDKADIVAFLGSLTDETLLVDPRFADPFAASGSGDPDAVPVKRASQ